MGGKIEGKQSGKPVVLVIDDSEVDRAVIVGMLSEGGYEAHGMPTAIGATRAARQLNAQVVILDQSLPALDGSKLAALFRQNPSTAAIRLVMVSSGDENALTELVREAKVDAFVSKRVMHEQLVSTVRRMVASPPA
jgi:CheY-like chemotaxis protein